MTIGIEILLCRLERHSILSTSELSWGKREGNGQKQNHRQAQRGRIGQRD